MQYWIDRYRQAGEAERASGAWARGSPVDAASPARPGQRAVHDRVCEARERTGWGPRLIAGELGMAHATVSRCLARRGISRAPGRRASRSGALSGRARAICCKWTPSAWRASPGPGTVTGDRSTHQRREEGPGRLGVLPLDHRRPLPAGLHRAAPRRARRHRHRLRRTRAGVLRRPRHHARAACRPTTPGSTSTTAACASCSPPRHPAPPDPAADPQAQRQIERYQQTLAREWAYGQRYRSSTARAAALPTG